MSKKNEKPANDAGTVLVPHRAKCGKQFKALGARWDGHAEAWEVPVALEAQARAIRAEGEEPEAAPEKLKGKGKPKSKLNGAAEVQAPELF